MIQAECKHKALQKNKDIMIPFVHVEMVLKVKLLFVKSKHSVVSKLCTDIWLNDEILSLQTVMLHHELMTMKYEKLDYIVFSIN